jgi:hypothetical protein
MSCIKFQVWKDFLLLKGEHALPCFLILAKVRDGRYKACLVDWGHRQRPGLIMGRQMPLDALISL